MPSRRKVVATRRRISARSRSESVFNPRMGAGAIELFVKRAMLLEHAVDNIRCDPPRRETGHFGWQSKSL